MDKVWAALVKRGDDVTDLVFDAVRQAFKHAQEETNRQTATEEAEELDRVRRLAIELKEAIERSSLPRNWATQLELTQEGEKSLELHVGWRDLPKHGFVRGFPISIVELLDLAVTLVDRHITQLPPRAVLRNRGATALPSSFVRWLTWHLSDRGLCTVTPTVMARIANAALDLKEPLDKDDVKTILKEPPPPFRES
jgi:hypothetical protein